MTSAHEPPIDGFCWYFSLPSPPAPFSDYAYISHLRINELPTEVLVLILEEVGAESLARASGVCTAWRGLILDLKLAENFQLRTVR